MNTLANAEERYRKSVKSANKAGPGRKRRDFVRLIQEALQISINIRQIESEILLIMQTSVVVVGAKRQRWVPTRAETVSLAN